MSSSSPDRVVVLVATRNPGKLREIEKLLPPGSGVDLVTLGDLGIGEQPEEDAVERFATFEENARAKAMFFRAHAPGWVLAEDSGLCVDALDGSPGVRSKRFSGRDDLSGPDLDRANNEALLRALEEVPDPDRTAAYECAMVLLDPSGKETIASGRCDGHVLREGRGTGGFGYDPLFQPGGFDRSMAELPPSTKNRISHRRRALDGIAPVLRELDVNPGNL